MKTKITSLLAVTLTAATFFSCSNEIEAPDNGQMLNPGDAQISIGLGNGATTYSTITLEKMIHDGSGRLFKADGNPITLTNPKITGNKFTATVPAGSFTENSAAKLYLYANGTPSVADAAATETDFAKSTVNTVIGRELPNGLPAGFGPINITLKSGSIVAPAAIKLNRAAARVGAAPTDGTTSLVGYKVALNNVNITSGSLFQASVASSASDKVERTLDGVTADMFGGAETVGYVYPSTQSSVTVTAVGGQTKTVPFTPIAGKNYTVKIKTPGDASFNWDIEIAEWDGNTDIDADLNITPATVNIQGSAVGKFEKYENKGVSAALGLNINQADGTLDINDLVTPPAGSAQIQKVALGKASSSNSDLAIITVDGSTFIGIKTTANYAGTEIYQTLHLTFGDNAGKETVTQDLVVFLLPAVDYLAKVEIPFQGTNWLPFNTSGNLATDQTIAKGIWESAGATIAEKTVAYAYVSEANYRNVQGVFFLGSEAASKCPAGYEIAKLANYKSLTGEVVPVRPGAAAKWLPTGTDTQTFANSTAARITKPAVITGALGFYYQFTDKGGSKNVLPFIGSYSHGLKNTNTGGALTTGFSMFTGDMRDATNYERVAPFNDGWANNATVATDATCSNVRCVKIK